MNWRDLLYFSKGERRAFTILLCLITLSWIVLLITDSRQVSVYNENKSTKTAPPPSPDKGDQLSAQKNNEPKINQSSLSKSKKNSSRKINLFHSDRIEKTSGRPIYPRTEKFPEGTIVDLNTADTTVLKKVPGIGSAFANRIVKYRQLLGGFCSVDQLNEVYGIDEERYHALKPWFSADPSRIILLPINDLPTDSLWRHPYLNNRHIRAIKQLRRQKGRLSGWDSVRLLEEFTEADIKRLTPYVSF